MYYEVNNHLGYKGLHVDLKKVAAFLFNFNMTQTQIELSKNKPFLLKRIQEQEAYTRELFNKFASDEINFERYKELFESASGTRDNLKKQLFDLIKEEDGKKSSS